MIRSILERLWKRLPDQLRERARLGYPGQHLYPVRRSEGWIYFEVGTGGALVSSGGVYYPPDQGAEVTLVGFDDASPGRFGVIDLRNPPPGYANGGPIAAAFVRPADVNVPLRGIAETYQFAPNLSDLIAAGPANSQPVTGSWFLWPPNAFIVANRVDDAKYEGGIYVREFVTGVEDQ